MLPVVVLTSSIEREDVMDAYSRGANSYIQKPVDFTRFAEVVRGLGLYWLLTNVSPSGKP
jgi:DNA-binding NarL/FixJ family response regulator